MYIHYPHSLNGTLNSTIILENSYYESNLRYTILSTTIRQYPVNRHSQLKSTKLRGNLTHPALLIRMAFRHFVHSPGSQGSEHSTVLESSENHTAMTRSERRRSMQNSGHNSSSGEDLHTDDDGDGLMSGRHELAIMDPNASAWILLLSLPYMPDIVFDEKDESWVRTNGMIERLRRDFRTMEGFVITHLLDGLNNAHTAYRIQPGDLSNLMDASLLDARIQTFMLSLDQNQRTELAGIMDTPNLRRELQRATRMPIRIFDAPLPPPANVLTTRNTFATMVQAIALMQDPLRTQLAEVLQSLGPRRPQIVTFRRSEEAE